MTPHTLRSRVAASLIVAALAGGLVFAAVSAGAPTRVPVLARTALVARVSGSVSVRAPGATSFSPLTGTRLIRFGSTVRADRGVVEVTTATVPGTSQRSSETTPGGTQSAQFYSGQFVLEQVSSGVTGLRLDAPLDCVTSRHAARSSVKHAHGAMTRSLWGDGHGLFTTIGRDAAATVLGTKWLTTDTCASTAVYVATGRVLVRNLVTHAIQIVTGGTTVTVRAPGAGAPPLPKTHSTYATPSSDDTFHLNLITSESSATTLVSGPQPPPIGSQYPEATGTLACPKAPRGSGFPATLKPFAGFGFPGATLALSNDAYSFAVSWTIPSESVTASDVKPFAMHLTISGTVTAANTIAGTFSASGGPCAPSAPIHWTATLNPSDEPAPGQ